LQIVQADPSEPCPEFDSYLDETRADSDHIHQHALITSYM